MWSLHERRFAYALAGLSLCAQVASESIVQQFIEHIQLHKVSLADVICSMGSCNQDVIAEVCGHIAGVKMTHGIVHAVCVVLPGKCLFFHILCLPATASRPPNPSLAVDEIQNSEIR